MPLLLNLVLTFGIRLLVTSLSRPTTILACSVLTSSLEMATYVASTGSLLKYDNADFLEFHITSRSRKEIINCGNMT